MLRKNGNNVINCEEDADTAIVRIALDSVLQKTPVIVIAEDTDVFVMLVHLVSNTMGNIFFQLDKVLES